MEENVGSGSLDQLVMKTGELGKLGGGVANTWKVIAGKLHNAYQGVRQDAFVQLGVVYYSRVKGRAIVPPESAQNGFLPAIVNLLEQFMTINGQWRYLQNQDWYRNDGYVVAIDVNYYPDRSGSQDFPAFHKDTGGNNLFVSLIFDNAGGMDATEWFEDVERPSARRREWQGKLLPPALVAELNRVREHRGTTNPPNTVHGATRPGPYTYVSWVDDLVWHATPTATRRLEYSVKAAREQNAYQQLAKTLDGAFWYVHRDGERNVPVNGLELLATIAQNKGTRLYRWLAEQDLGAQDIITVRVKEAVYGPVVGQDGKTEIGEVEPAVYERELADRAWREVYGGDDGEKNFYDDVALRGDSPWKLTGKYAEAIAYDERLEGSQAIYETPRTAQLTRRDSDPDFQARAREAREAEKMGVKPKTRSFLRTWVRILKPENSELGRIPAELWKQ